MKKQKMQEELDNEENQNEQSFGEDLE